MNTAKMSQIKRLLLFLDLKEFEAPTPLPEPVLTSIKTKMANPVMLIDRDVRRISYKTDKPNKISIYTALISGHNGDAFDQYRDEVDADDVFLDFVIAVLNNRAYNKISDDIKQEERKRHEIQVRGRLKELGFAHD